jgi:molybdopterin-binding protein
MEAGSIVQVDTPQRIFQHPKSEFVARFVGIRNFYPGKIVRSDEHGDKCAEFVCSGLRFQILSDTNTCNGNGNAVIRSEDVTISTRLALSSARNVFEGSITDIFPVRLGVEVIVDIGVEMAAIVTRESMDRLGLKCGKKVYASIKASAIKFLEA